MSKLIIEEPPLQVLPSLALAIGLNEAIVIQQLHYLLRDTRFGKRIEDHQWIFNTVEQWVVNYFPFWSVRTMKTIFTNLADMNLIVTCQPEGRVSRRKYYRINTEELTRVSDYAKNVPSLIVQKASHRIVQKTSLPTTKTSSKTSSKNTKGTFPKAEKVQRVFSPRFPYPNTEDAMAETLEHHGIEYVPDYDGQFFETMNRNGWTIQGKPVFDWMATYIARLQVTSPGAFNQ